MTYPTMTASDQRSAADTLRAIVAKEQSRKERRKKIRKALGTLAVGAVKTSIRWAVCGWAFIAFVPQGEWPLMLPVRLPSGMDAVIAADLERFRAMQERMGAS
jgi:hypothetical protein